MLSIYILLRSPHKLCKFVPYISSKGSQTPMIQFLSQISLQIFAERLANIAHVNTSNIWYIFYIYIYKTHYYSQITHQQANIPKINLPLPHIFFTYLSKLFQRYVKLIKSSFLLWIDRSPKFWPEMGREQQQWSCFRPPIELIDVHHCHCRFNGAMGKKLERNMAVRFQIKEYKERRLSMVRDLSIILRVLFLRKDIPFERNSSFRIDAFFP